MKKFVITEMVAGDIANLRSLHVKSGGSNILVTGQNGAGKSTLAKTILWTFMGRTADGEKLIPIEGGGLPYVEIELTDGTTYTKFRKEIIQSVSKGRMSRTTDCFMNGLPVTLNSFQEFFNQYMPTEIFSVLMGLGNFFKLKSDEQRQILTEHFGNVNDAEIAAEIGLDTNGLTVEAYGNAIAAEIRKIKRDVVSIPKLITELENQTADVRDDRKSLEAERLELEAKLQDARPKAESIREARKNFEELKRKASQANQKYFQLRDDYQTLADEIAGDERELEKLREQYETPIDSCPMCGQTVQGEQLNKIREKIAAEGKKIATKVENNKAKLATILEVGKTARQELDALSVKLKAAEFDSKEYDDEAAFSALNTVGKLQSAIYDIEKNIAKIEAQLEINARNDKRIEELKAEEKTYGRRLTECEGQLALVEKFTHKKMELITDAINSQFQFVKFRMFETLKNGEVRNTCVATLNGVPYENLSKGEKLKAALDILQAFQNYYAVMLPLIIDDAESYTSNSLIEIQNQQILLKAVEGQAELQISSGNAEKRRIA